MPHRWRCWGGLDAGTATVEQVDDAAVAADQDNGSTGAALLVEASGVVPHTLLVFGGENIPWFFLLLYRRRMSGVAVQRCEKEEMEQERSNDMRPEGLCSSCAGLCRQDHVDSIIWRGL